VRSVRQVVNMKMQAPFLGPLGKPGLLKKNQVLVRSWHCVCKLGSCLLGSCSCGQSLRPKEQTVSGKIERKDRARVAKSLLAASSVGVAILSLAACSGGGSSPQPIQSAPASALTVHLKQCYAAKLNGSARTVIREKVRVCRRNSSNQVIEQEVTPRFQVGRTKGNKIGFRQVIAVKFTDSSGEAPEIASERKVLEASAFEFLTKGCAPILNSIFQRSGFESSHRFQVFQDGDQVALSSEVSENGKMTDPFEFGDSAKATPVPGKPVPVVVRPGEDESTKRAYHLLLEMKLSKAGGLRLQDELAEVESGSLVDYLPSSPSAPAEPIEAAEAAKLQFCGQLAMRVAENYGLSEGRDCESMAKSEDSELAKNDQKNDQKTGPKAQVGLMKPGKTVSDLKKVKLAKREIHEILSPVCGPLKDQKGL